jgi:hypothetical protein
MGNGLTRPYLKRVTPDDVERPVRVAAGELEGVVLRLQEAGGNGQGNCWWTTRRGWLESATPPHDVIRRGILERDFILREVAGFEFQIERDNAHTWR